MSDVHACMIVPASLAQCTALVSQSDVSDQEPFAAFSRLGLQLVRSDL